MNRRQLLVAGLGLVVAPRAFAGTVGGTPLALVTADLESHVVAVDLASGRVSRRVPTIAGPRSIERVGASSALVAHTSEGAVSLVDGRRLRVRRVVGGFAEPRYTALHPGGRVAYVTDSAAAGIVVVDVVHGEIIRRVPLGGPARHVSVAPQGTRLWVALGSKAEEVVALDVREAARPRILRRLRPPYLAHDVGFSPNGAEVWVTSGDRGTIGIYDARSYRVRRRLPADAPPQHVTFIGGRAYVASGDDGTLHVHRLDGHRLRSATVPVGSYNVQQGWGVVLNPSLEQGTLTVVDRTGSVVRRETVARSSHDACFVMSA